jgi:hypothetical protein
MLHADFLFNLSFTLEDGGGIFFRNTCLLSPDYIPLKREPPMCESQIRESINMQQALF